MKNIFKILSISVVVLYILSGCVKENFDIVPDKEYTVDFEANTSIAELKEFYSGSSVLIDTNIIIKGIITANDVTGNFFKEIFIQDSSAAINIRVNISDLSVDYPLGQLIFIKCSGLYLGTYNGVYQLGSGLGMDRIEEAFIENYLYKSDGGQPVEPKIMKIDELNDDDLGILIQIDSLQFQNTDQTYADAENQGDRTTVLEDCNGNTLDLRNSGFADFAGDSLPTGNGSIIGIHGKYFEYQLKIRSVDDVDFTGEPCSK